MLRSAVRGFCTPFQELAYVAASVRKSFEAPTGPQVLVGVLTKGPVFVTAVSTWTAVFLPQHVLAFALLLSFSTVLEVFHGVFASTWLNTLQRLERERGLLYLMSFNLAYMQSMSATFRTIAWTARPEHTVPPWTLAYWRDMSFMSIVGGMVGALAYSGINALYAKGYVSPNVRTYIQHLRDFFTFGNGVFFDVGLMFIFWSIFFFKQCLDVALYLFGKHAKPRPGSEAEADGSEVEVLGVREAFVQSTSVFTAIGGAVRERILGKRGKDEGAQQEEYGACA